MLTNTKKFDFKKFATIFQTSNTKTTARTTVLYHFSGRENECGGARFPDSHDDRSETFGIVFRVTRMQGDRLQIQWHAEIHRRDDVLQQT